MPPKTRSLPNADPVAFLILGLSLKYGLDRSTHRSCDLATGLAGSLRSSDSVEDDGVWLFQLASWPMLEKTKLCSDYAACSNN